MRRPPRRLPLEIVAIAEPNSARRARAGKLVPGAVLYEDPGQLLASEAHRLDYVDIATPPYDHARLAHMALDKGLHVLCEKPMATTPADARSVLEHAMKAKRVFFPCHNYKHAPVVKAVKQVLESGLIGKVNLVTLHTFRNTHAKGVSEWRPDWRRERKYSGGGIAMDHGAHTFYLAFDWLRGYPTAITAKMATPVPTTNAAGATFDTEDNFSCTMTFPEGIASAHLTWTAGVRKVIYTIQGARGAIRVEDDDVEVAVMASRTASTHDLSAAARAGKKVTWELEARAHRVGVDGRRALGLVLLALRPVQGGHRREGLRRRRGKGRPALHRAHPDGLRLGSRRMPRAAAHERARLVRSLQTDRKCLTWTSPAPSEASRFWGSSSSSMPCA